MTASFVRSLSASLSACARWLSVILALAASFKTTAYCSGVKFKCASAAGIGCWLLMMLSLLVVEIINGVQSVLSAFLLIAYLCKPLVDYSQLKRF
jgi:hypothetical protein